jgi:hypothetical protein
MEMENHFMDIIAILTKTVREYRKQHGVYPGRIEVSRDAAMALATEVVRLNETFGICMNASPVSGKKPDEEFLDGGMLRYKGIPVIAELEPDRILKVE